MNIVKTCGHLFWGGPVLTSGCLRQASNPRAFAGSFLGEQMTANDHYQAIVIGSGQGANPLCSALAAAGWHTALVEREHIGGTCINEGCTPTKTMVASGRVAYLAKRGAAYGVRVGEISVDMARVRERKRKIVESFRGGSQARLQKTQNLELIFGEASFNARNSVLIRLRSGGERKISGDRIFINAGCRPSLPTLQGLQDVPFLNSTSIMELDRVPEHLLVVGGGYIGLEFGQLFRRLGSAVTIVQSGGQLLAGEDADVADDVAAILREDGIEVLLDARTEKVSHTGDKIRLAIWNKNKQQTLEGSHLLIATGRRPNSDRLNLPAAGIATDERGYIRVNERLETSVAGIYALGDIKGGPAFTHISYDDFRILRANLLEKGNATTAGRLLPYAVFIDPQLGRVGVTEAEARTQGRKVRVAKMPMNYVARALEVDETRGFIKAIVDAATDEILGAAVLGIEGGEIMAQLQIAMMGKLAYTVLRDGVFAHPTLAECLNNLFQHFNS
jgi:pyruvate/2-oxoglutarate dehydrogenase complex dihydrolipoamide dehydrogenase (E3) component